jgi:hypothetical protein
VLVPTTAHSRMADGANREEHALACDFGAAGRRLSENALDASRVRNPGVPSAAKSGPIPVTRYDEGAQKVDGKLTG